MADQLQIVIWNVAHGSATFVRTPNNRTVLLDAGSSDDFSPAQHLRTQYGLTYTDALILSHGDADHVRDIANVWSLIPPRVFWRNATSPRELMFPGSDPPQTDPLKSFNNFNNCYNGVLTATDDLANPVNWGGVRIRLFCNTAPQHQFTCLNDYSLVTIIDWDCLKFVFPGDIEPPGCGALMQRADLLTALSDFPTASATTNVQYRVLVAPHHGRDSGVYDPFLQRFAPHLTIISGKYGDPHTNFAAYSAASAGLRVTDRTSGSVADRTVLTTKRNDSVLLGVDPARGLRVVV